jgi:hypothetical protein
VIDSVMVDGEQPGHTLGAARVIVVVMNAELDDPTKTYVVLERVGIVVVEVTTAVAGPDPVVAAVPDVA